MVTARRPCSYHTGIAATNSSTFVEALATGGGWFDASQFVRVVVESIDDPASHLAPCTQEDGIRYHDCAA
jgi:hypothetical protein